MVKKKQAVIRINAEIKKAVSIAGTLEDKHLYEMVEKLLCDGLRRRYPDLYARCVEAIGDQYAIKDQDVKESKK